jgi:hypothetical protein
MISLDSSSKDAMMLQVSLVYRHWTSNLTYDGSQAPVMPDPQQTSQGITVGSGAPLEIVRSNTQSPIEDRPTIKLPDAPNNDSGIDTRSLVP